MDNAHSDVAKKILNNHSDRSLLLAQSGHSGNNPVTITIVLRIIQANIDRFKLLLETEANSTKRAMLFRLLAEEEGKLKDAMDPPPGVKRPY